MRKEINNWPVCRYIAKHGYLYRQWFRFYLPATRIKKGFSTVVQVCINDYFGGTVQYKRALRGGC